VDQATPGVMQKSLRLEYEPSRRHDLRGGVIHPGRLAPEGTGLLYFSPAQCETKVYGPYIQALLGTASHFVLKLRTLSQARSARRCPTPWATSTGRGSWALHMSPCGNRCTFRKGSVCFIILKL
jgi:hypothetical protein